MFDHFVDNTHYRVRLGLFLTNLKYIYLSLEMYIATENWQ